LTDGDDEDGPKLQVHVKLFLASAEQPLSPQHFENLEVLLQLSLTQISLQANKTVLLPVSVPVNRIIKGNSTQDNCELELGIKKQNEHILYFQLKDTSHKCLSKSI
jgi:hypothetical protein